MKKQRIIDRLIERIEHLERFEKHASLEIRKLKCPHKKSTIEKTPYSQFYRFYRKVCKDCGEVWILSREEAIPEMIAQRKREIKEKEEEIKSIENLEEEYVEEQI